MKRFRNLRAIFFPVVTPLSETTSFPLQKHTPLSFACLSYTGVGLSFVFYPLEHDHIRLPSSFPDTISAFTLRTFETNIAANANKTAELKASVDSLVTDTIAGIQDDIAKSENTQASARTALENKLEQSLAAKEKEIYKATDSLEAENVKVDSCGKAGKLYTKGGCKTIEIPDTNLAKYTSKGCDIANSGRLEYNSVR